MEKKENSYQKPKIKAKKILLNMFYSDISFFGNEGEFLASCWCSSCSGCICPQPGCGSDCAC